VSWQSPNNEPAIIANGQRILAREDIGPDGSLDHVRIHVDTATVEDRHQVQSMSDDMVNGIRQIRGGRDARYMILQPDMQSIDDRAAFVLPDTSAVLAGSRLRWHKGKA
jgi:hypothetical protein